jgi:GntR family transcriptional regulator, transcriptional repressor for pyruvate dehydrogenase complex
MFDTLVRSNLSAQIADHLLAYIQREQLQPNDPIPSTADLAQNFGVSRPVVREALKILEARGIIEVVNGKRATVKPLSAEPLLSFFERVVQLDAAGFRTLLEVREAIETQNARLAAERCNPGQAARMRALTDEMRRNLHNLDTFVELDVALHLLVAEASQNAVLAHLTASIRDAMKVIMLEGRRRRADGRESERVQEQHEALVEAITRGDGEGAASVMRQMFADQRHYLAE